MPNNPNIQVANSNRDYNFNTKQVPPPLALGHQLTCVFPGIMSMRPPHAPAQGLSQLAAGTYKSDEGSRYNPECNGPPAIILMCLQTEPVKPSSCLLMGKQDVCVFQEKQRERERERERERFIR